MKYKSYEAFTLRILFKQSSHALAGPALPCPQREYVSQKSAEALQQTEKYTEDILQI